MSHGGARPGAGRPPGRRSDKTEERLAAIEESGLTPLEYLLMVMRDETLRRDVRVDAAKAAAPYVHPRLSSTDIGGKKDSPLELALHGSDVHG